MGKEDLRRTSAKRKRNTHTAPMNDGWAERANVWAAQSTLGKGRAAQDTGKRHQFKQTGQVGVEPTWRKRKGARDAPQIAGRGEVVRPTERRRAWSASFAIQWDDLSRKLGTRKTLSEREKDKRIKSKAFRVGTLEGAQG